MPPPRRDRSLHSPEGKMAETTPTTASKPAERISQAQRAASKLRDMIIFNRLPPGSNHLEAELGEMLGMSRTPVREAAVMLEAQGLVELRPRRGVRIRPILVKDMDEIYSILTELESLAAHDLAAARPPARKLTILTREIDAMEKALEADDRLAWAQADDNFHRALVELSENQRLIQIVSMYSDQVHRARLVTLFIRPKPSQSNADHRELVEAIKAGDAERARAIHRAHRIRAKHMLTELMTAHGFSAV